MKYLVSICAFSFALADLAQASTVVWADDFNGAGRTNYNPYSYTGASGNDYIYNVTNTPVTHVTSVSNGVLNITDGGLDYASLTVTSSRWTPFTAAAGDTVTFAADINVSSFSLGSDSAAVPRMVISVGGATVFTLGFGRANVNDGIITDTDLFFYTTANGSPTATPSGSGAIGLDSGSDTGWLTGFNFGQYDSTTAANNDTNGSFYRLEATFTQGNNTINASLTRLDGSGNVTAETASFTVTMTNAANFNSGSHSLYYTSGSASQSSVNLDNLSVTVNNVPEPARALLILAGVLCLGVRRSRN